MSFLNSYIDYAYLYFEVFQKNVIHIKHDNNSIHNNNGYSINNNINSSKKQIGNGNNSDIQIVSDDNCVYKQVVVKVLHPGVQDVIRR